MSMCQSGMLSPSMASNGNYFQSSSPSGYTLLGALPYGSYYSKFMLHAYRPSAAAANMQSYPCAERVQQPFAAYPPSPPNTQISELYLPLTSHGWVGCRR